MINVARQAKNGISNDKIHRKHTECFGNGILVYFLPHSVQYALNILVTLILVTFGNTYFGIFW